MVLCETVARSWSGATFGLKLIDHRRPLHTSPTASDGGLRLVPDIRF